MGKILVAIIFTAVLINGCWSQILPINDYAKQGIGMHIDKIKKLASEPGSYASRSGWHEKTYKLENGNWVYVELDSKNCFIHWEVNPEGIIVNYRLEGNCH
jgi:hypothetical protein